MTTNPHETPASDDSEKSRLGSVPESGRLAGIDFGTVRVGISVSDAEQTIASPLETYNRRTVELDRQYFLKLVSQEAIVGFVVGLPVHMSGDESEKSRQARDFGQWVTDVTGCPVCWIDERFTTAIARDLLSGSQMSPKKRKAKLDKIAAQVILSAYLESRKNDSADLSLDD